MSNSVISFRLRVTEESVRREFSQFGEVVDVRGAGLFEVFIDFSDIEVLLNRIHMCRQGTLRSM